MTAEIWYLLFGDKKEILGVPSKVEARDIDDLKTAVKEARSTKLQGIDAADLIIWRCKKPLLSTQDEDELQEQLLKIDFHNKEQVVKLASGAEIADLKLGGKEVLLVQVPGAISKSSFISCSQACPLDIHSKKRKLEGEETPSTKFFKSENIPVFTA